MYFATKRAIDFENYKRHEMLKTAQSAKLFLNFTMLSIHGKHGKYTIIIAFYRCFRDIALDDERVDKNIRNSVDRNITKYHK